jgi:recombinational DNA repair protein (RecF pathway)
VSGPIHQIDAWVLAKRPPSDTFITLTIFSRQQGAALAIQRISKKSTAYAPLDLFDEASLSIEEPSSSQAGFIKEARLLTRHTGIGQTYESLTLASKLATLIARNPVGEESRESIYELLRLGFAAFAASSRPDVVYLKSLYRFCRDEGYPLKQAWVPALPSADRAIVTELLNQPVNAQTAEPKTVARLVRRLEDYLRGETEFILD